MRTSGLWLVVGMTHRNLGTFPVTEFSINHGSVTPKHFSPATLSDHVSSELFQKKPRLSTKFGKRAFSFAGPHVWNQLPQQLRAVSNPAAFKKHLKNSLFKLCFN